MILLDLLFYILSQLACYYFCPVVYNALKLGWSRTENERKLGLSEKSFTGNHFRKK